MTQVSVWDTPEDAQEFYDAYVKRSALRYPDGKLISESQKSRTIRHWQTAEGGVLIELRGLKVVITEGLPASLPGNSIANLLAVAR